MKEKHCAVLALESSLACLFHGPIWGVTDVNHISSAQIPTHT